jgi:peptidoglycan hydrolase CwlO-like protein
MEHKRILELALEALEKRKTQVEAEVKALRAEMRGSGKATSTRKAGPTASASGRRRAKTPAERKAQSKRMKAYWAAKKAAAAAAKAKKPAQSGPKGRSKRAE